ncbi:MAG: PAS domain-containing protein [Deltaproteobacteria bacterium]|nr:PAS domain-containing protein [Deltaproteobacteria bacterium]MCW5804462.1 PAS domain-containing protein [Deltaproteobacteria bacterium]
MAWSKQLLDHLHDAFSVLDRDWRFVYVNQRACELSELTAEEMLGRTIWEVFPVLVGGETEDALRAAMAGEPQRQRFFAEPQQRWYDKRVLRLADGVAIISTDVTDELTAEARFRALAESMPQIVWTATPDGTITFINQRWTDLTGLDMAATNAPGVADVFHPDDRARAATRWRASLASGAPHEIEWRIRRATDGAYRWFLTRALPRRDAAGEIVEWFGTATDIHERKLGEERLAELARSEREAHDSIARIQDVTSALSSATTADEVAEVTCRIGAQAMGAHCGMLWLLDDQHRLVLAGSWGGAPDWLERFRVLEPGDAFPVTHVAATGEPMFVETRADFARTAPELYERLAAASHHLAAHAVLPVRTGSEIDGVLVFCHPLDHPYDEGDRAFFATLAQNCQQALHRARLLDEARIANRAKDEFLAMLGHELRNPLSPIVTALDLIRARESTLDREHAILERQVQHLKRLVDDLLDVSAIAAGRVQLELTRLAVEDVIERAVETTRPLIEQREHTLETEVERDLWVDGDAIRLAQVITNLLTNAAKYTPAGGRIRVHARRAADAVIVRVADNGAGISGALLPHVFDLFQQGPQPVARSQGGLGLGLSIVRSLVGLHGGTVSAHSDGLGLGSELVVTLPASRRAPASADAPVPPAHTQLAGRRILIVDDNEDAAMLLAEVLRRDGAICHVVHSAEDAIERAGELEVDVALLDLGLPRMDGYELRSELAKLVPAARMIAVTGYGLESDQVRTREAGFHDHVVKPVNLGKLRQLLSA